MAFTHLPNLFAFSGWPHEYYLYQYQRITIRIKNIIVILEIIYYNIDLLFSIIYIIIFIIIAVPPSGDLRARHARLHAHHRGVALSSVRTPIHPRSSAQK